MTAVLLAVVAIRLLWECEFLVDRIKWESRKGENSHARFTQLKSSVCDAILMDTDTLIIHKSVYLISIILIIYQDKKIG